MLSKESQDFLFQHVKAMRLCLDNKLIGPTLILIYSCMDAFGALMRPRDRKRNVREDFVKWAEKYVTKGDFPVTALELYSARCGLVHNLSADSNIITSGQARPIFYAWGDKNPKPANDFIRLLSKEHPEVDAVILKVEDLFEKVTDGFAQFLEDLDSDEELAKLVRERFGRIFANYGSFPGL